MNSTVVDAQQFDLFRLTKSKELVDISPNTIRAYGRAGLPLYRRKGERSVFVSRSELASFLKAERVPV